MLLARYLKRTGRSGSELATALGVSKASVSLWLRGLETPNRENAFAIERETGGEVPASSWVSRRSRRAEKRPRRRARLAPQPA